MVYPSFSKYQQAGNDFIIFDDRTFVFPVDDRKLISRLCHRKFGIGADGVILLQSSNQHDFCMRIFNSDGNEAESCGNGICCLANFIQDQKLQTSNQITIELIKSVVKIYYRNEEILVQMDDPINFKFNKEISFKNQSFVYHFVDTGVPHFVSFVEDIKKINLKQIGPYIRGNSLFAPHGTNVSFAVMGGNNKIFVRTYERGVEGETLACGTGACAVALIGSFVYNLPSPVKICYPGGKIMVHFQKNQFDIKNVSIVGISEKVYEGVLPINCKDGDTYVNWNSKRS